MQLKVNRSMMAMGMRSAMERINCSQWNNEELIPGRCLAAHAWPEIMVSDRHKTSVASSDRVEMPWS